MKTWGILILALSLGACATPPTMEELEAQAWLTGDWTAVERREDAMARREARRADSTNAVCDYGLVAYCETDLGTRRCTCVNHDTMRRVFEGY